MPVTSISVFSGSTLRLFRLKVVVPTGRCSPVTAAATPTPGASIMFTRYRSTAPATARFLSSSLIQSSISKSVIEAGSTRSELARTNSIIMACNCGENLSFGYATTRRSSSSSSAEVWLMMDPLRTRSTILHGIPRQPKAEIKTLVSRTTY